MLQDVDKPLTFLTIYDSPYELPDLAIIKRLQPYCEVAHTRHGRYAMKPSVCNGLRHYRVRIISPIPSYLRFGPFLVELRHDGHRPTCRRCNQPGHFALECCNKLCFNCEQVGHEAPQCPSIVRCNISKDGHLARSCIFSWLRAEPVLPSATDEARVVDVEGLVSPPHQTDSLTIAETISSPRTPSVPVTPTNDTDKKQDEQDKPMTHDNILDSQGHLVPESTPTTLIPRPPLTDSCDIPTTENRFNILTDNDEEQLSNKQDINEADDLKQTESEIVKPSIIPDSFKSPATPNAVSPSPSILPQRTTPIGRRKPAHLPDALTGLVRKVTIPRPVATGESKPSSLQSTSAEGEEEMEVQQVQWRKRGPDEPPPKSPPKRKGSWSKARSKTTS